MTSTVVYAIYDKESGLYVTRGLTPKLDELGICTRFFNTKSDAMRFIEAPMAIEISNNQPTQLQNNLAWWLLEKMYEKERWFIDCDLRQYKDALTHFNNLKVVSITIRDRWH